MVISLDSEIATFEPFGRSIVSSVPEHKSRGTLVSPAAAASSTSTLAAEEAAEDQTEYLHSLTLAHHLHNDFTAAEVDNTRDLFRSLNGVSMSKDGTQPREFWRVRKCAKGEEEIYVNENTVVCSFKQSTSSRASSLLDKTYTFEEKVLDANWCAFITNDNLNGIASQDLSKLMFKPPPKDDVRAGGGVGQYPKFLLASPLPGDGKSGTARQHHLHELNNRQLNLSKAVCILDRISIHMLTENGDHHRKPLQFNIKKMVPTPFGLLLERSIRESELLQENASAPQFPLIFTLSNPLNEIVPVLVAGYHHQQHSQALSKTPTAAGINSNTFNNNNSNIGYITSKHDFVLVDFIVERHFAVFYCSSTGTHYIFYLRPVNGAELDWIRQDLEKPMCGPNSEQQAGSFQTPQSVPMDVDGAQQTTSDLIGKANGKLNEGSAGLNHSQTFQALHNHLVSTPISSGELTKKRCRLSYPTGASSSSPVTRSRSNNLLGNLPSVSGGANQSTVAAAARLSSPRNLTTISSPHNSSGSRPVSSLNVISSGGRSGELRERTLSRGRVGASGVLSPSTSKLTSLLSGRLDSPLSPSGLSHLRLTSYSTSTTRLMETDADATSLNMRLASTTGLVTGGCLSGSHHKSKSRSRTVTFAEGSKTPASTPTVERGVAPYDDLFHTRKLNEPIIAEFTLDYVWSETVARDGKVGSGNAAAASKVFATVDLLGQNYLALLVPEAGAGGRSELIGSLTFSCPQTTTASTTANTTATTTSSLSVLRLIKFDVIFEEFEGVSSANAHPRYVFGSTTRIGAVKDAQPLPSLNMLLVLDETSSLVLYSGTEKVSIVHLLSSSPRTPLPVAQATTSPAQLNDSLAAMSPDFRKFFTHGGGGAPAVVDSPSDIFSLSSSLRSGATLPAAHSSPIVNVNESLKLNLSGTPSFDDQSLVYQGGQSQQLLLPFSIQQYPSYGRITALKDPIEDRLSFATEDGTHYRLAFPPLAATFLVGRCLAALRTAALPRKEAAAFLATWYTRRNSTPDSEAEAIPEMALLKQCLLSAIGYDVTGAQKAACEIAVSGKLLKVEPNFSSSSFMSMSVGSPKVEHENEATRLEREITKKMKIEDSDQGTDEDWYALLRNAGSLYGLSVQKLIEDGRGSLKVVSGTGGFGHPYHSSADGKTPTTARSLKGGKVQVSKSPFTFASPGVLFPYTVNIFSTLHLLYEDLKLVQMNWPLCRSLVDLLYLLAVDCGLADYQDHYYRDFADVCAQVEGGGFGVHRTKIASSLKTLESTPPPSIYHTLYSMLVPSKKSGPSGDTPAFPFIGNGAPARCLSTGGAHIVTPNIFNLVMLYANLHSEVLVQPSAVLKSVSLPQHNRQLASSSVASSPGSAGGSTSYISMAKYSQIVGLFGGGGASPSLDSPRKLTNQTDLHDLSAGELKRLAITSSAATSSSSLSLDPLLSTLYQQQREPREKVLFLMSAFGITADYLKELPFGVALPLWEVIYAYRRNPKNDWCSSIYALIDRPDLLSLEYQEHIASVSTSVSSSFATTFSSGGNSGADEEALATSSGDGEEGEGHQWSNGELAHLDHTVLRLLFPTDQRLHEAYTMLVSSRPAVVAIVQRHGVSDHDFAEEQEKHLYALCIRTMALPLGRGMVTMRSYHPVAAERFPIPPLVLTGRVPPRNTPIELAHIEVPANMNIWPLFHNGVSAGLRIVGGLDGGSSSGSKSGNNSKVDSSWILFNKPANNTTSEEHYAHAGFLLALGLNGLLDHLSIMDLHEYLSKGNDLTKVAILLGLAASRRGTMDSNPYILLGIHLEGLLPSTSTELDVSPIVKVAAVLGVGLLFQGTGHSYIAEVMLNEIGRPPGPEMEHYIDRESYALSAGLAFGLVTLGRGDEMIGSAASAASGSASSATSSEGGLSIPDQLNHYMLGVHKKLSTLAKEKHKTPSYHIREGECINADVTSPGATLALGMMFFGTGNKAIAQWLEVPNTQNLLETVRPDFILLRVLAKSLILWKDIRPTGEWIEAHIPPIVYCNAFQKVTPTGSGSGNGGLLENELPVDAEMDYETMTQSYCNIIAGACFALALKYAGSADVDAFEVVKKYTVKLITIIQKGSSAHIEQAGRSTIESCVNVLIVSCSIIMAGTGNVEVMRLCRYLRSRVAQVHVLYGSYMASHVALGLLFLGGCRMTLNSSPQSVAALICAFFPKWPIHTYDNRYHLQAFRHLYVLATEPRMVIPRCIDTGTAVYAKIIYRLNGLGGGESLLVEKMAPCLLPDLELLQTVQMVDENYWQISFDAASNFAKLRKCLLFNGNLYIKRKVKCLSYNKEFIYNVDERGGEGESTEVATKTTSSSLLHKVDRKSFTLFDLTNEVILKTFSDIFINSSLSVVNCSEADIELKNRLCALLYDCAEDETLELFAPLIRLLAAGWAVVEAMKRKKVMGRKEKKKLKEKDDDDDVTMENEDCDLTTPTSKSVVWLGQLASGLVNITGSCAGNYDADRGVHQKYFTLWQIKMAARFISSVGGQSHSQSRQPKFRFIEAIQFQLEQLIKATVDKVEVRRYLYGHLPLSQASETLIDTAVYYDLPTRTALSQHKEIKFVDLCTMLRASSGGGNPSTRSAFFIYKLLKED